MEEQLAGLGIEGSMAAASAISSNAENYTNNPMIEQLWAIKAIKYAETHMRLLKAADAKSLSLTKYDDEMYQKLQEDFSDIDVKCLDPDSIKSAEAKERWRPFCNSYEEMIQDFNFGTLLRIDPSKDYSEDNTILVPRAQFIAIEVARNRLGLNSVHHSQ
ncbi:PREDICTED: protein PBDC1-like [Amphimedon queenslandica]|nr:PREDICTED: protein PBDC1-like [Amphimedon queenslandica]|eukprot:XP_003383281.1 PREDICTED: protein PBDC1-like [Amphimedon queenslandica]